MECDPSIKSIIVNIDSKDHAFIVEELDDQTLVVKENMLSILKMRLEEVRSFSNSARVVPADERTGIEGDATTTR